MTLEPNNELAQADRSHQETVKMYREMLAERDAKIAKLERLETIACEYIKRHEIFCSESIYQMDEVILTATGVIEEFCDVVGYYEIEEAQE